MTALNDACGHAAGDELLRQLVRLLISRIRQHNTLARLGGDEFGLMREHCDLEQAEYVIENLRKAVADFIFVWGDKNFPTSLSIDLVPVDASSGRQPLIEMLTLAQGLR